MYNESYNRADSYYYGRHTSPQSLLTQPIKNISSEQFRDQCSRIDTVRNELGHIKPTTNNNKSSRGHLFIHLKVTRQGSDKVGRLIICDMGGRENPNEMWNSGQYCCVDKSDKSVVLGPIVKTKPGYYYDSSGNEQPCKATTKSTSQIFTRTAGLGGAFQARGLSKQQEDILETLKQGFYINDSVNEILKEFGYDFKDKEEQTNWSTGTYKPDIRALSVAGYKSEPKIYKRDEDKIGIREIFKAFKSYGGCKIKFCTFACIRSPSKVLSDSIATLEFATAVNSCVNSETKLLLPPVVDAASKKIKSAEILKSLRDDAAAAGLSSQKINDSRLRTHTDLFPTVPGQKGGMSSRKNKRAIHKSTLKANVNAKVKPSHVRVKRKTTTTRKHRKNNKNKNNKNNNTIKNRVEKMK